MNFQSADSLSEAKKIIVHLLCGFLGSGKTTLLRHFMTLKKPDEKWAILVNEFGKVGIDGALLSHNEIKIEEISGGCLCCQVNGQLSDGFSTLIKNQPHRIFIESSGLAHGSQLLAELQNLPFNIEIGAVLTLVDPRHFIDDNFAKMPLYRDQISVADVLVFTKKDLCSAEQIMQCENKLAQIFPPKSARWVKNGQGTLDWLTLPKVQKSRYRVFPEQPCYEAQGLIFPIEYQFDAEKIAHFFDNLPKLCGNLIRAKGFFYIENQWICFNWSAGSWGISPIMWQRESRLEWIANQVNTIHVEKVLNQCVIP